jgi:hypothetical protein
MIVKRQKEKKKRNIKIIGSKQRVLRRMRGRYIAKEEKDRQSWSSGLKMVRIRPKGKK